MAFLTLYGRLAKLALNSGGSPKYLNLFQDYWFTLFSQRRTANGTSTMRSAQSFTLMRGGIIANLDGTLLRAGSVADPIHLLVVHPRTHSPAELIQEIKTGTSKWLKTRQSSFVTFHWQRGYGAFSISPSHRVGLETYIGNQAEHHRIVTFQEEYRKLFAKYEITYEERYVWD